MSILSKSASATSVLNDSKKMPKISFGIHLVDPRVPSNAYITYAEALKACALANRFAPKDPSQTLEDALRAEYGHRIKLQTDGTVIILYEAVLSPAQVEATKKRLLAAVMAIRLKSWEEIASELEEQRSIQTNNATADSLAATYAV